MKYTDDVLQSYTLETYNNVIPINTILKSFFLVYYKIADYIHECLNF